MIALLLLPLLLVSPKSVSVTSGYIWTFQYPRFSQDHLRGRIGGPGWFTVLETAGRCKGNGRWVKIGDHAWVCTAYTTTSRKMHDSHGLRDWYTWFRPGPYYMGTGHFTMIAAKKSGLYGNGARRLRGLRGFMVVRTELSGGRPVARTFEGNYISADSLRPYPTTAASGITLSKNTRFPIALVAGQKPQLMRFRGGRWVPHKTLRRWTWREILPPEPKIKMARLRWAKKYALKISDIRIAFKPDKPQSVGDHEHWIHVDLDQNLVFAMEGSRVVRIIPANSGPNTPAGLFRIYWKVLFDTMDRQNVKHPYLVEAVPYVLYFKDDFALHAAYWQTEFGNQSSHGCINLPVHDAAFLFLFASPALPRGFTDLYTARPDEGTVVQLTRNEHLSCGEKLSR